MTGLNSNRVVDLQLRHDDADAHLASARMVEGPKKERAAELETTVRRLRPDSEAVGSKADLVSCRVGR